jgi:hypothetical protein
LKKEPEIIQDLPLSDKEKVKRGLSMHTEKAITQEIASPYRKAF